MSEATSRTQAANVTLVSKDGKAVKCTTKTPVISLVREFRKRQRSAASVNEEYNKLLRAIKVLRDQNAPAEEIEKQEEALTECDDRTFEALIHSVKVIINVPNTTIVQTPGGNDLGGIEAIDFDNSDLVEIQNASNFFATLISG